MQPDNSFQSTMSASRRRFEAYLATIFAEQADPSFAVLTIGVGRLDALNEILGYAFTDLVLELADHRICGALRNTDKIVRVASDEFLLLLDPVQSVHDIQTLADRLIDLVQRSYAINGQIVNISANIGIALGPHDGTQPETLLKRSSVALGGARMAGPGQALFFDHDSEDRMVARHALAVDLRKALLLRQLEVHYQPQVDMASRRLTGFEALLRWRHPIRGFISPAEFIPLAEEIDMIGLIGDWVLRTACREAARMPDGIGIAVNASPLQFRTDAFVVSVERALSLARLPATRLEIEITEGLLIKDTEQVLSTLNNLHTMGVRLAMDDFGTGYSSLGKLASLPFDTIKIDRSLIGGSIQKRAVVRSVVALGKGLGMSVLAEGLESEEDFALVYSDGCTLAQGYLFGKAVPASNLHEVVSRLSLVSSTIQIP